MIHLNKVSKQFRTGVFALNDISFEVEKGEFVFLVGPTGSGKTTIFRLLTRESLPTSGEIIVDSWDITKLPNSKIPHLRKKIGVVFQDLKLLMDRTIFENIILPLEVSGIHMNEAKEIVEDLMGKVGILDHKDKFPIQLSGGELQRVVIARALTLSPDILLADEPTGNLDQETAFEIVKLLSKINKKGTTIIMATHNLDIIKSLSKRVIALSKDQMAGMQHSPKKSAIIETKEKKEESHSTLRQAQGSRQVKPKESKTKEIVRKEEQDEDF